MTKKLFYTLLFTVSLGMVSYYGFLWFKKYQIEKRNQYFIKMSWKITNSFSFEELIGQLFHISIPKKIIDKKTQDFIDEIKPGGVILFGRNLGTQGEILSLTALLQSNSKIPLFISTDQEGGRVKRVKEGVTQFPSAMAIGQAKNSEHAYKVGFTVSYQLRKLGINLVFAPVLDINKNPNNPVIGTRSFGSNIESVTQTAIFYEKGAREGGAVPVIKHFPGHGDTNIDSHLGLPIIDKTWEELENFELVPFNQSIKEGAKAVMSAHILFPKIDKKYPATLSKEILQNILRKKMKFNGLIITDDMEMDAIDQHYKNEKQAVLAVLAGANILLLSSWGKNAIRLKEELKDFFRNKDLNIVKQAVQKQILSKIQAGLFHEKLDSTAKYQDFFTAKAKKRETYYQSLNLDKLNQEITQNSIKAYPKEHLFTKKENLFIVNDPVAASYLSRLNIDFHKDISSLNDDSLYGARVVLQVNSQRNIDSYKKFISKHPNTEFVMINFKKPFFKYPKFSNLIVLLSFSDTSLSKKSLIDSILKNKNIKKTDLNML